MFQDPSQSSNTRSVSQNNDQLFKCHDCDNINKIIKHTVYTFELETFFTISSYNKKKRFYNNLFENIDSKFSIVFAVTKVLNRIGKHLSLSGVER